MSYKNKYLTLKINKKHYDIFCRLHVVLVRLENKQFVSKLFACDEFAGHACEQKHVYPFDCDPFFAATCGLVFGSEQMNVWELPSGFKESLILVPDSIRTGPFKRRVSQSHPQYCCRNLSQVL